MARMLNLIYLPEKWYCIHVNILGHDWDRAWFFSDLGLGLTIIIWPLWVLRVVHVPWLVFGVGWTMRAVFWLSKTIYLIDGSLRLRAYRAPEVATPVSTMNEISSTGIVLCTQDMLNISLTNSHMATNTRIFILAWLISLYLGWIYSTMRPLWKVGSM